MPKLCDIYIHASESVCTLLRRELRQQLPPYLHRLRQSQDVGNATNFGVFHGMQATGF
jgi:hypothetical protein